MTDDFDDLLADLAEQQARERAVSRNERDQRRVENYPDINQSRSDR